MGLFFLEIAPFVTLGTFFEIFEGVGQRMSYPLTHHAGEQKEKYYEDTK